MEGRAAFLAQKSVIGYCRLRTGSDYDRLMAEPEFVDALERSRWTAFAGTLGDVVVAAEAFLRPACDPTATAALAGALADFYPDILLSLRPDGSRLACADELQSFRARFSLATSSLPAKPERITAATARMVFESLPVHSRLRRHDFDVIDNDLRFGMVACWQAMEERFVPVSLIHGLLAANPPRS